MAAQKKTAEVDYSMQEKILALYELQKIDSKIDEINKIKGELPLEVQDLEDELAGLNTRIEHINGEMDELNALTKQRKREVDQAKIQISNYKEQQNNVRNNREFDAITKEIEYQELEIELAEKRLKEYAAAVKAKKAQLEETEGIITDRKADLEVKQGELKSIEEETASQVAEFGSLADTAKGKIDERLLAAYDRIRRNVHNGLPLSARRISVRGRRSSSANTAAGFWWQIPKRRRNSGPVSETAEVASLRGRNLRIFLRMSLSFRRSAGSGRCWRAFSLLLGLSFGSGCAPPDAGRCLIPVCGMLPESRF